MKNVALVISSIVLCIFLALAVLASVLLPCTIAFASDTQEVLWAPVSDLEHNEYAGKSSILLYNNEDEFYIPESYYVTDIQENKAPGFYTVKYCGIEFAYLSDGNLSKQNVSFSDGVSPYPNVTLHPINGADLLLSSITITDEYTITFLGYSTKEDDKIYVVARHDGYEVFGFALTSVFEPFTVPYHPNAEAERNSILNAKPAPDPEKGDIVPNTSLALRIVLIIGIAIPAVVIVILLFKPTKNDHRSGTNQMHRRQRGDFDYDSSRSYAPNDGYDDRRPYDNRYDDRYDSRYNDRYDNRYDDRYDSRYDNRYDNRRDANYDDGRRYDEHYNRNDNGDNRGYPDDRR